jgi:hypothetical protein
MTDYAVHVLDAGEWVLDSIFDDPEFAIFEASALRDTKTYGDVRVVELQKGEQGDIAKQTLFLGSEPSPYTEEIVRRFKDIRDKTYRMPPGLELRDEDATID